MAGGLAYMKWYAGEFLRETRGWSVTAKGICRELIDAQWEDGELPADPEKLRALIGATRAEWRAGWPKCERKFPLVGAKKTVRKNAKISELFKADEIKRRKCIEAGAAGGRAKALANATATATANATETLCPPTPTPTIKPKSKKKHTAAAPPSACPEFQDFKALYPKRSGDQLWEKAKRAVQARLAEGYTWPQILEGTRRYASFAQATGIEGTRFVKQAVRFLGPDKSFLEPWEPPQGDGMSARMRRNAAATAHWVPPEVRHGRR